MLLGLVIFSVIAAVFVWHQHQMRDGRWHHTAFRKLMRRMGNDGKWQYRMPTAEESHDEIMKGVW
jgi:hypothetical protein